MENNVNELDNSGNPEWITLDSCEEAAAIKIDKTQVLDNCNSAPYVNLYDNVEFGAVEPQIGNSTNSIQFIEIKEEIELEESNSLEGFNFVNNDHSYVKKTEEHSSLENGITDLTNILKPTKSKRQLPCPYCDYIAGKKSHYDRHVDAVHHKLKKYKCEKCDFGSTCASDLSRHIENVHMKIKNFKCAHCDFATYWFTSYKSHIGLHHKLEILECEACISGLTFFKEKNIPEKRVHKCDICDLIVVSAAALELHVNAVHHKIKNFSCEYCGHRTTSSGNLKTHIKSVHHKLKDHKCKLCGYAATHFSVLRIHVETVHENIRKHKCKHCDYSAAVSRLLKDHVLAVHEKIRNFECESCKYTAATISQLKRHIKCVHYNLKNYKCELCDYTANTRGNVRQHTATVHYKIRRYKCKHCDYSASSSSNLKYHLKRSHGELEDCDDSPSCNSDHKKWGNSDHNAKIEELCEN